MSKSIAAIHVAKRDLGLDDDTYRAKLMNIVGTDSTKKMTEDQRQKVLTVLRSEGFKPTAARRPDGRQKLSGRFAAKLQALWIAGWNLGIFDNRDDAALEKFVKRQTGLDAVRFCRDPQDANKAIEALKAILTRDGGVRFGNTQGADWLRDDIAKVTWAQWQKVEPGAELYPDQKGFPSAVSRILARAFPAGLEELKAADWRQVSNALGELIRTAKKAGA